MFLRPTRSEVDDQTNRPSMLHSDSRATNPAAAAAPTGVDVFLKKSWIIGDAFSRMPMPAVTLKHRTTHRHQNCGVLIAFAAETFAVLIIALPWSVFGCQPAGFQSSAGTRTSSQPINMNAAYTRPCTRNAVAIVLVVGELPSIDDDHGEAISAPPPKPMIAMPVAMPGRSGNHLMSVDTGEM